MAIPNSPWIMNAQTYHSSVPIPQRDAMWHTVDFLLRNHRGIANKTSIESILQYLSGVGFNLGREAFQQTVLGDLKRRGIVVTLVYSGPGGGVFIPLCDNEVKTAARKLLGRIESETENLHGTLVVSGGLHNATTLVSGLLAQVRQIIGQI